jgi:FAD/FMN-containing dehydrogenase/Fe-S oxidoreductase
MSLITAPGGPASPMAALDQLADRFGGELHRDATLRTLYSTDASEYRELPLAVAMPRSEQDVAELVAFAGRTKISLIPRAAGTSLAGQVVGNGVVVDLGRHLNRILSIDPVARRVRVQPGVVRNELNLALKPHGLFFTPETSTANRAMIGGMVGNNSCGANSIQYGSTRDHLVTARGFLSDGTEATFGPLSPAEFSAKCNGPGNLETRIYRLVRALLGDPRRREAIRANFPKAEVTRRNTGYALDALMDCAVFDPQSSRPFNLCRLIAGSEGTLFFGVEFELNCEPLPPAGALMCAHFDTIDAALKATVIAMRHHPSGCELIDRNILECTKTNLEQAKNRFFVQGDPGAVLVIELRLPNAAAMETEFSAIEAELRAAGLGYAFPVLRGNDCGRVWDLRRAGQGIVNNLPGEAQPREIVEDTAVAVEDLPAYIAEFDALLRGKYGLECIYYAHAGAGELHTRPLFNLKTAEGLAMFRSIATDVAALVKKYRGSLSGEHGDGRLRGEFIEFMVGEECYGLMQLLKTTFDPLNLFNPGKIIGTPPMDTSLRHGPAEGDPQYPTVFDFAATRGILAAAEKCTGVGECRKTELSGGTMCPSYMATRNEKDTTRARANMLREVLTRPKNLRDPWDSAEVAEVMDLCLSCKGCKSECPSNVDMARLKAEWQQHYYDANGVPFRSRLIAGFGTAMRWASLAPGIHNWLVGSPWTASWIKRRSGFAPLRSLPRLPAFTLAAWHRKHANRSGPHRNGRVHLFCDEFTDYYDAEIGAKAIGLLNALGYEVILPRHGESGRAHFSKGLVREAQKLARRNVELLRGVVTPEAPLIGIEPSAILGFRDEYPALMPPELQGASQALAQNAFLIDEFIAREAERGRIASGSFTTQPRSIKLHGHCHQKALSTVAASAAILQLPANYRVELIPSGCCGMAGSFGYEAEHFAISQQIGELVLFPAIRAAGPDITIAAPGTSCRHQIKDGTGRVALHPVEILAEALIR